MIGKKRGADVLRPVSLEHPDDEAFEGLLIVRPEGRLFFINAQDVTDRGLGHRAQASCAGHRHEPRFRHRIFSSSDDDRK